MPIQPKQLTYFDWFEVTEEVERLSGKNTRNWAGKSFNVNDPNYTQPYLDFWHHIADSHSVSNGCIITIDFEGIFEDAPEYGKPEDAWQLEIYKLYQQVVGGLDEATFYVSW